MTLMAHMFGYGKLRRELERLQTFELRYEALSTFKKAISGQDQQSHSHG